MFAAGWIAYRFRDCTDGLSNTFLIGETLPARTVHAMYFNSSSHMASVNIPPNYWKINPRNCPPEIGTPGGSPGCHLDMQGFNSYHPGVVQMAMADGSVNAVTELIDYRTWVYLGDRDDGVNAEVP
jgi:prepilin-type processing-associated H-X9-DG protein